MPQETKPQDNINRLLEHLKDNSLAARLVQAYHEPGAAAPSESMKAVLRAWILEQIGTNLDRTKD